MSALGNANVNVGGREISIGQQSVNIRGIGLIDSGGDDDLAKGYRVDDIENVVLSHREAAPPSPSRTLRGFPSGTCRASASPGAISRTTLLRPLWLWAAPIIPTT